MQTPSKSTYVNYAGFITTALFIILSLANHILFLRKATPVFFWQLIPAFLSGFSLDIAIYSLVLLFLFYLNKKYPILQKASIVSLFAISTLPLLDFFYFNATLERFNWIVLEFINIYSFKGYLGNLSLNQIILIISFICLIAFGIYITRNSKIIPTNSPKPIAAITIFCFFSYFFFSSIYIPLENNFTGHVATVCAKNLALKNLSSGSISGFFANKTNIEESTEYKEYSSKDKEFLTKFGLLPTHHCTNKHNYERIVFVVLESFALEYIHTYNSLIPEEASNYLDYLIKNYPHCDNFYTSNFPSLEGFNAILSGRILFNKNIVVNQKYNLASLFENQAKGSTFFLRGTSRYYGSEDKTIEKVFGFSHLYGYEDLAKKYPEPAFNRWGYNDEYLYKDALNIMEEKRFGNYLITIKLLNQHQPISKAISESELIPENLSKQNNSILNAIYDANYHLKQFIETAVNKQLLDDKTLIIVTADHYPPIGYGHADLIQTESYNQLGKLPLIFVTTNKEAFHTLSPVKTCCQIDIAPTICELAGFEESSSYQGNSLISENFIPRSIGVLNKNSIYIQTEELAFSESLTAPATSTKAILKWINNLNVLSN